MLQTSSPAELSALKGFSTALRIQRGFETQVDDGLRSPIFKDEDARYVLNQWNGFQSEQNLGELAHLEQIENEKTGPFFRQPWSEWKHVLADYFRYEDESFSLGPDASREIERAFEDYVSNVRRVTKRVLHPTPPELTMKRVRKNTNLGFPDVTSNWKAANLGHYISRANDLFKGKRTALYPFVLFRRVQPGGPERKDAKQRPVWGADHAESFCNLGILHVLIDALRSHIEWADLQGIDYLEHVLTNSLPLYPGKLSLDLSAADKGVSPRLLRLGLRVVNELVAVPTPLLEQTYEYYVAGRILTPDGLWGGSHGLPSGVAWTNLLERFIFGIIARVAARRQGVNDGTFFQNGDDGLYLTEKVLDSDKFAETFKEFGLDMNVAKSSNATDYCSYLQRHFYESLGWTAIMSTNRMLGRILYQESGGAITDYLEANIAIKTFWSLNTIMKLENCKRHPLFGTFVKFVQTGDKYGLDISGIVSKEVDLPRDYGVLGHNPDEDSVNSRGLMKFETVKLLAQSRRIERDLSTDMQARTEDESAITD